MKASDKITKDTKWIFFKQGTCSRAMFFILNQEFGHPMVKKEQGTELLAGGILQHGYQCGLLWGAAMGAGAEAYHRSTDKSKVVAVAIEASKDLVESFEKAAGSSDCEDITNTNWKKPGGVAKYFLTGKMVTCYKLADRWAPEMIKLVSDKLDQDHAMLPSNSMSCASEVIKRMGGDEEDFALVAGWAGGIGLSGNGCGALAAAIWHKTIKWADDTGKTGALSNPLAQKTLEAFFKETDYEFECQKICGQKFESTEDHTQFIRNGGCKNLIDVLGRS